MSELLTTPESPATKIKGGVRLREVTIEAFRSIVEETTIAFPESGMICVSGDSGAGKTSINLAISYALGYCPYPATALQSWLTDKPMRVKLVLDTADGQATLVRGKTVSLTVGDRKITSAAAVESKLSEFFSGLPVDILGKLVYRPQKTPGLFLSMDDADKKEFLGSLLGLAQYEEQIEVASANVARLAKVYEDKSATYTVYAAGYESARSALGEPPQDSPEILVLEAELVASREKKVSAKERYEEAKTAYDGVYAAVEAAILAKQRELEGPLEAARAALAASKEASPEFVPDRTKLDEAEAKIEGIEARLTRLREADALLNKDRVAQLKGLLVKEKVLRAQVSQVAVLSEKKSDTERKLAALIGATCFTCQQPWHTSEIQVDAFRDEIKSYDIQILEAEEAEGVLDSVLSKVRELNEVIVNPLVSKFEAILAGLRLEAGGYRQELAGAKKLHDSALAGQRAVLEGAVGTAWAEYSDALAEYKDAVWGRVLTTKNLSEKMGAIYFAATEFENNAQKNLDAAKRQLELDRNTYSVKRADVAARASLRDRALADLKEAEKGLVIEKDVLAALKGFLNAIFDEVLAEVSEEANRILVTLPNVSRCTIEFRTDTVTKKGSTKKSIVPVVTTGGYTGTIKYGCSGGMATAIELAVDLAVTSVVQARTGACPQWVVLDEAFDGLDANTKEACLEILKTYAADKLVLVVSHVPEFREVFTSTIKVSLDTNEQSVVSVG